MHAMKAGIAACVALSGRLTRQSPSRGREPPAYPDPFCRRFARVTRQSCIGVFLCLTGFPFGIAAQQRPATPSLPQQIADAMVQLNGGIHTGYRFAQWAGTRSFLLRE
jgi:hypothetical protein